MAPAASTKLTYEDYLLLPDDGKRHEIINGERYVNPAPNTKHQRIVGNPHALIWTHTRQVRSGTVFIAPCDVILADEDVVQPDVLYITPERVSIVQERGITGAPDLVIEVLSDSTRKVDQTLKLKRYGHFGVKEYWMVDPDAETVALYRRAASGLEPAASDDPITSPLLPGLALLLSDLFAE